MQDYDIFLHFGTRKAIKSLITKVIASKALLPKLGSLMTTIAQNFDVPSLRLYATNWF